MKYAKGYKKLGLPKYFKFGIELEAFNVKTKGKDSLYSGKSAEYIKSKNWRMATIHEEILVRQGRCRIDITCINRFRSDLGRYFFYV